MSVDPGDLVRHILSNYPDLIDGATVQSLEPSRIRLVFSDGTYMDIRYNDRGRYSYHWQRGGGETWRFDNAPHHPEVPTYPHHLHYGLSGQVLPSRVKGASLCDVDEVMQLVRRVMGCEARRS